jgi:hypothetical protein
VAGQRYFFYSSSNLLCMFPFRYAPVFPLCFLRRPLCNAYALHGCAIGVVRLANGRYLHFHRACMAPGFVMSRSALWFVSSMPHPGGIFFDGSPDHRADGLRCISTGAHRAIKPWYQRRMHPITLTIL